MRILPMMMLFLVSISYGCETLLPERTTTVYDTHNIVLFKDGTFMMIWNDVDNDNKVLSIKFQRYDSALNHIGEQITYHTNNLTGSLVYGEMINGVTQVSDSSFAVIYKTSMNVSQQTKLYFTIIDKNGTIIKYHGIVKDDGLPFTKPMIKMFNDDIIITMILLENEILKVYMNVYSKMGEVKIYMREIFEDPDATMSGMIQLDDDKMAFYVDVYNTNYNFTHYRIVYNTNYEIIEPVKYLFMTTQNINSGITINKINDVLLINWMKLNETGRTGIYRYFDFDMEPLSDIFELEEPEPTRYEFSSGTDYVRQVTLGYVNTPFGTLLDVYMRIFYDNETSEQIIMNCYDDVHMYNLRIIPTETNKYVIFWRTKVGYNNPTTYGFKILVCSDELTLDINKLSINDGQTVQLSTKNIYALNGCNKTNVNYTIANQEHIIFKLNDTIVSTFTSEDIDNGFVWVYHDGSGISPNYEVVVSHKNTTTEPMNAIITFNGEEIIVEISSSQIESDSTTQTSSETSSDTQTSSEQTSSENEKSESSENEKSFSSDTISSEETHENSDTKIYSSNEGNISSDSQSSSNTKKLLPWEITLIVLGSATVVGGSIAGGTFYAKKRQKKIGNTVEMT